MWDNSWKKKPVSMLNSATGNALIAEITLSRPSSRIPPLPSANANATDKVSIAVTR